MSDATHIYYDKLFPRINNNNTDLSLQISKELISYITTPVNSKLICKILRGYLNRYKISNKVIMDCTACVGGDTLGFANIFEHVISIEIDKKIYDMLVNNIKVYNLSNIHCYNENCINILKKINYIPIIYFDPPWGGSEYKKYFNLRLKISNIPIEDITANLLGKRYCKIAPKMVIYKLPKNYDFEYLTESFSFYNKYSIFLHEFKKMVLAIIVETN